MAGEQQQSPALFSEGPLKLRAFALRARLQSSGLELLTRTQGHSERVWKYDEKHTEMAAKALHGRI